MAKVVVKPLPDGTTIRGNWQVKKSGRRMTKHRKKTAAIRQAYREGASGDALEIRRLDGTVQDVRTIQ